MVIRGFDNSKPIPRLGDQFEPNPAGAPVRTRVLTIRTQFRGWGDGRAIYNSNPIRWDSLVLTIRSQSGLAARDYKKGRIRGAERVIRGFTNPNPILSGTAIRGSCLQFEPNPAGASGVRTGSDNSKPISAGCLRLQNGAGGIRGFDDTKLILWDDRRFTRMKARTAIRIRSMYENWF